MATINSHKMITRSKKGNNFSNSPPQFDDLIVDDIDDFGNIRGLIDYDYDKKNKNKKNIADIFTSYILFEKDIHSDSDDLFSSDDEYYSELDEFDEEFDTMNEDVSNIDKEFEYFYNLNQNDKKKYLNQLKNINNNNNKNIPPKFKILSSDIDIHIKTNIITNIDALNNMEPGTGEYSKMEQWINYITKIPFNKTIPLPINSKNDLSEKQKFISNTKKIMDQSIYGHEEAKNHILQVIGKWIQNPSSQGNILAIQGPMGNGKTTLIKEGVSKAINRPFHFIALGGASDSSYLNGHSYTYEGSRWGRIVDILIQSQCMNPIIYFDELDKVSETYKGEEIIHMLTHLTDPSQNTNFQDNYFPGINIDLSKILFIFSFNDESKINKILKDRMYVINTEGFNNKDKIKISKEYLLPELYKNYSLDKIIFTDNILDIIINNHTENEKGVRNLKRCLETIISKINIYNLSYNSDIDL